MPGAKGQPQVASGDAPSLATQLNAVSDYAATVGTRRVGTVVERDAYTTAGYATDGDRWYVPLSRIEYLRDGGAWTPIDALVGGRASRNTTTYSVGSVNWQDIGAAGIFGAAVTTGGITWSNGFVIPDTGEYEVGVSLVLYGTAGVYVGIGTLASGLPAPTDILLGQTVLPVQSIVHVSIRDRMTFTTGQKVRLFALASTGSLALQISRGSFTVNRVG